MGERRCSVDGCTAPLTGKSAKGMCPRHYQRWLRNGTATSGQFCAACGKEFDRRTRYPGPRYCQTLECQPPCSVEGCDQPRRKRTWCASHYAQWTRYGKTPVPFKYKWSDREPCIVCGTEGGTYRRFCSSRCLMLHKAYNGDIPSSVDCVACGIEIDLTERGKKGQRRKVTTKFCRPCKRDYSKYKLSARELAERDGTDCGICGEPVDMTLRRRASLMCASVDHIMPRALGGTHEPENLQLAHLYCNQVKSDGRGSLSA